MKRILIATLGVVILSIFYVQAVQAKVQIGASGVFGLGGEMDVETEWNGGSSDYDVDLDPTAGFGLYVETPVALNDQLIIGGETRFLWINPDNSVDEDIVWDLCVYIKFSYNAASFLNLYLRAVPGFSLYFPDSSSYDNGVGFNIGVFAGPEFKFNENFGLFTEVGFLYHKVYGEGEIGTTDIDYEFDFIQFHVNVGLFAKF